MVVEDVVLSRLLYVPRDGVEAVVGGAPLQKLAFTRSFVVTSDDVAGCVGMVIVCASGVMGCAMRVGGGRREAGMEIGLRRGDGGKGLLSAGKLGVGLE